MAAYELTVEERARLWDAAYMFLKPTLGNDEEDNLEAFALEFKITKYQMGRYLHGQDTVSSKRATEIERMSCGKIPARLLRPDIARTFAVKKRVVKK